MLLELLYEKYREMKSSMETEITINENKQSQKKTSSICLLKFPFFGLVFF